MSRGVSQQCVLTEHPSSSLEKSMIDNGVKHYNLSRDELGPK
jgi:hypothetical protein